MGTFVSDRPGGPYAIAEKNPLIMAYKSCAYLPKSCDSATYFARFWLRYDDPDPSSPQELLVVHQSYVGLPLAVAHSVAMICTCLAVEAQTD